MTLVAIALDRNSAEHLAIALRVHRNQLAKRRLTAPPALAELERVALLVVREVPALVLLRSKILAEFTKDTFHSRYQTTSERTLSKLI